MCVDLIYLVSVLHRFHRHPTPFPGDKLAVIFFHFNFVLARTDEEVSDRQTHKHTQTHTHTHTHTHTKPTNHNIVGYYCTLIGGQGGGGIWWLYSIDHSGGICYSLHTFEFFLFFHIFYISICFWKNLKLYIYYVVIWDTTRTTHNQCTKKKKKRERERRRRSNILAKLRFFIKWEPLT